MLFDVDDQQVNITQVNDRRVTPDHSIITNTKKQQLAKVNYVNKEQLLYIYIAMYISQK